MPRQSETIDSNLYNDKESSITPILDDILEDDQSPLIATPAKQQAADRTGSDIAQVKVVVNVQKPDQASTHQASKKSLKANKKSKKFINASKK